MLDARLLSKSNVVMSYIGDIAGFWASAEKVNRARNVAEHALANLELYTESSKRIALGKQRYNVSIALEWWKEGILTVKASHACKKFYMANPIV